MPREYYDRGERAFAQAEDLTPAPLPIQEGYWLLKAQLAAALVRNWQTVLDSSPEIQEAAQQLNGHVQRHPKRTFRAIRPEDANITIDVASSLFLR